MKYTERVELHCHTKMSEMDSVVDVNDLIKKVTAQGHRAVAVTDHGNISAFSEMQLAAQTLTDDKLKVIYGVEAYAVDDLEPIVIRDKNQKLTKDFVVVDIETTGFSSLKAEIIQISAVKFVGGTVVDTYSTLVKPNNSIPEFITELTGISNEMIQDKPPIDTTMMNALKDFVSDFLIVTYNANFNIKFFEKYVPYQDMNLNNSIVDTYLLAKYLLPLKHYSQDKIANALSITVENTDDAMLDVVTIGKIYLALSDKLNDKGITNLQEINRKLMSSENCDIFRKLPSYHLTLLAKNETGIKNIYKLVEMSNTKYYCRRPRIPMSEILRFKDGILIGSGCEAGKLYRSILEGAGKYVIKRLVSYCDFLEVQPAEQNIFCIGRETYGVDSLDDLLEINKKIVALGEEYNKPVVATGDVHFLDREDGKYRNELMLKNGYPEELVQPPLFFRTTKEMLDAFEYLGEEKAKEIVIDNSNMIADMCDKISLKEVLV